MHLNENLLRAFIDDELPTAQKKTAAEHLAGCEKCSVHLRELQSRSRQVSKKLQILAPLAGEIRSSPQIALRSFVRQKEKPMSTLLKRPAWVAAGLAVILAISLLFPPVRALANSFLGIFRVQQVQVISFDPANLEQYNNAQTGEAVNAFFDKNIKVTSESKFTQIGSQEEAAVLAGFTPRLPAGSKVSSLGITSQESVEMSIDATMLNAALEAFGYPDVKISSELDGQKITATIPAAVTAAFGECPDQSTSPESMAGCIVLIQLPSPTVTAPDNFPVVELGEVMFQVMGMSPDQAAQLSQSFDWSSTLILPVPSGQGTQTSDILVDGVQGTLIREPDMRYLVIWVKDGILYGLSGIDNLQAGLRLVESLE